MEKEGKEEEEEEQEEEQKNEEQEEKLCGGIKGIGSHFWKGEATQVK